MVSSRKTPQGGFTLIELVVVIVILGILAAFAIPRFANIARDARVSALNGLAGSLRSTSALVHGMALARNATVTVALEGATIDIVNGYPAATATGVVSALNNLDTATFNPVYGVGTLTIQVVGASTPAGCSVVYTDAPAGGAAQITVSATTAADC